MSLGYQRELRYPCPGTGPSRRRPGPVLILEVEPSVPTVARPAPPRIDLLDPRESSERIALQWQAAQSEAQEPPQASGSGAVKQVRALFVSDLHLGMHQNARRALCNLLDQYQAEQLYLVGDIVDAWLLPRRWHWDQDSQAVLDAFKRVLHRGGAIRQVPGNHDNYLRKHNAMQVQGWHLDEQFLHTTKAGETALVLHGDQFDPFSGRYTWMSRLGARIYGRLQRRMTPQDGRSQPEKGLAWTAKRAIKLLVQWLWASEQRACRRARSLGAGVVISGHTHYAKDHRRYGERFLNTGDWIDSCTCAVETQDGALVLCRWEPKEQRLVTANSGEPL